MQRSLLAVVLGLTILLLLAAFAVFYRDDTHSSAGDSATCNGAQTQDLNEARDTLPSATTGDVDVDEMDHRLPVAAPVRGDPNARDRATYDAVINQFEVEENPRYKPREDQTAPYATGTIPRCHSFVWDVTRAMGAEIPYWVDSLRAPNAPELNAQEGQWDVWDPAYWLSANGMNQWLNQEGSSYGWREVSAKEAQELANLGHPSVASWYEPGSNGHIGIVRPGEMLDGPALAQAGPSRTNYGHVYDYFPREGTQFFVNDTGTAVSP